MKLLLRVVVFVLIAWFLYKYYLKDVLVPVNSEHFQTDSKPSLRYDISTSTDAHKYALQKMCEARNLTFVDKGSDSYCYIDNEERCKQRNQELKDNEEGKMAFWTKDKNDKGVCVETLDNMRSFCDDMGLDLKLGVLECDSDAGFCVPKGYTGDPDNLTAEATYNLTTCTIPYKYTKDVTVCNEGNNPPTCTTFRAGDEVCRGVDWRGAPYDSNGQPLGNCITTDSQAVIQGVLGSDTFYKRFRQVGQRAQEMCGRYGPGSAECWEAIGSIGAAGPEILSQTGQQWFKEGWQTNVYNKWANTLRNPSLTNTTEFVLSLRQNLPSNWGNAKMGAMLDQLVFAIPGASKYLPEGLFTWMMQNKGQMYAAVALELYKVLGYLLGLREEVPEYKGSGFVDKGDLKNELPVLSYTDFYNIVTPVSE